MGGRARRVRDQLGHLDVASTDTSPAAAAAVAAAAAAAGAAPAAGHGASFGAAARDLGTTEAAGAAFVCSGNSVWAAATTVSSPSKPSGSALPPLSGVPHAVRLRLRQVAAAVAPLVRSLQAQLHRIALHLPLPVSSPLRPPRTPAGMLSLLAATVLVPWVLLHALRHSWLMCGGVDDSQLLLRSQLLGIEANLATAAASSSLHGVSSSSYGNRMLAAGRDFRDGSGGSEGGGSAAAAAAAVAASSLLSGRAQKALVEAGMRLKDALIDRRWWVDRVAESGEWHVLKRYRGVPGATVLAHKASFACVLVVQHACHLSFPRRHYSGYWYSWRGHNLTHLVSVDDVCRHKARKLPPHFGLSKIGSTQRLEEKMGIFLSPQTKTALLRDVAASAAAAAKAESALAASSRRQQQLEQLQQQHQQQQQHKEHRQHKQEQQRQRQRQQQQQGLQQSRDRRGVRGAVDDKAATAAAAAKARAAGAAAAEKKRKEAETAKRRGDAAAKKQKVDERRGKKRGGRGRQLLSSSDGEGTQLSHVLDGLENVQWRWQQPQQQQQQQQQLRMTHVQRRRLLGQNQQQRKRRVFLSPHNSFMGHFVERVGSLAEVTLALSSTLFQPPPLANASSSSTKSLSSRTARGGSVSAAAHESPGGGGGGGGEREGDGETGDGAPTPEDAAAAWAQLMPGGLPVDLGEAMGGGMSTSVLFGTDVSVSAFARHVARLLFGAATRLIPGRMPLSASSPPPMPPRGPGLSGMVGDDDDSGGDEDVNGERQVPHQEECFEEVVFTINLAYTRETTRKFRQRALWFAHQQQQLEQQRRQVDQQQQQQQVPANSADKEQLAAAAAAAAAMHAVPQHLLQPLAEHQQVTWLWRSHQRTVTNAGEVLTLLVESLPHLPVHVAHFSGRQSFSEVVLTMQRSALVLGMHGSAFANIIFMPEGASCLEMLPYKYRYNPFRVIAEVYGLRHTQWTNTHRDRASFDNGCFRDRAWQNLTLDGCWRDKACLRCVRDHAQTAVDTAELGEVLRHMAADNLALMPR